jgi:HPt (histidine-containing phosphotransfer) domain-containing protein
MNEHVLDAETIQNLRDLGADDAEFLPQMIALFLKGSAEKLPAIEEKLAGDHLKDVAALCHQLKSSSGNLGALSLGKLFEQLESEAHRADSAAEMQTFALIKSDFTRVEHALRQLKS